MKKRNSRSGHGPEFKGVVKKIAGKLTSDRRLEEEGRKEMLKGRASRPPARRKPRPRLNPDPHRRG